MKEVILIKDVSFDLVKTPCNYIQYFKRNDVDSVFEPIVHVEQAIVHHIVKDGKDFFFAITKEAEQQLGIFIELYYSLKLEKEIMKETFDDVVFENENRKKYIRNLCDRLFDIDKLSLFGIIVYWFKKKFKK